MSRIVFESSSRAFLQKVTKTLNGHGHELGSFIHDFPAGDLNAVMQELVAKDTELVAIGPDVDLENSLALATELNQTYPEISVVLVTNPNGSVWEPALRAGVADVLAPTANPQDLARSFRNILESSAKRRKNLIDLGADNGQPAPEIAARHRVITFISPKGGSGKTMTSTNLAVGLAQQHPGEVVIVDFDFEFGDVTNALLLEPENSIYDAAGQGAKLDLKTLKVFLAPHPSGLYVLAAPPKPELAEEITAEATRDVLHLLSANFKYVVVDTPSGMGEMTLSAIETSTDVVLMTALDVSSVRALAKAIDALDRLKVTEPARHFVLNRANARVGLSKTDIEELVGMPVDVAVDSSRSVALSMNQGSPIMESAPRGRVGKQLTQLVKQFSTEPASVNPWRFGR